MMNLFESIRQNHFGLRENEDITDRVVNLIEEPSNEEGVIITENKTPCTLLDILKVANFLKNDLQFVHWNITGDKFYEMHKFTDGLIETISKDIDYLAEAARQFGEFIPNLSTIPLDECYGEAFTQKVFTVEKAVPVLLDKIGIYLECMECYEGPQYIKTSLDDMMVQWRLSRDYFLTNMRPESKEVDENSKSLTYEYGDFLITQFEDGSVTIKDSDGSVIPFTDIIEAESYINLL